MVFWQWEHTGASQEVPMPPEITTLEASWHLSETGTVLWVSLRAWEQAHEW